MNKKITINQSLTFPVRTKCQKCFSEPKNYHCLANPHLFVSPNRRQSPKSFVEYIFILSEDFYRYMRVQDMTIADLSGIVFFKSFNPKLHKTRGNHVNNNVSECLTCACGKTAWWISNRINKFKPEFSNKNCRYNYPQSFKQ